VGALLSLPLNGLRVLLKHPVVWYSIVTRMRSSPRVFTRKGERERENREGTFSITHSENTVYSWFVLVCHHLTSAKDWGTMLHLVVGGPSHQRL